MSLTLSSRELALLHDALTVTASPLAYACTSDWRAAVRHAIEPIIGADKSVSAMMLDGEPYVESPAHDAAAWDVYVESRFADEQGDRRLCQRGPGVACMTMVHDVPALRRSELYNEFVRPYTMFDFVRIGLDLDGAPAPTVISFFHTSEHAPPFDEHAIAILELVRPVFRASVELLASLAGTRRDPSYLELVDALPEAAALCAGSGRVLHESRSLACLLAAEPRAPHLRAAIAAAARALASHTSRGGAGSAAPPVDAPVAIEVRGAHRRYAIRGSLLTTTPADARSATTIVLVSAVTPRAPSDAELRKRFGLTAREVEVTRLLAIGRSAANVAATLGVSYYTARHHVEHVLSKLGVRSRSVVAAKIAALADD
jgi:DNA-binding CsgD family transcriptional regulator